MFVRLASKDDIKSLTRKLQNKHIEYNTVEMMKHDVANQNLYVLIDRGSAVASCAIVKTKYPWLGVKRLCVFNKKNVGKGYASYLINAITANENTQYCVTPWADNKAMIRLMEKTGFTYQYTFNEKWLCYLKNNN